MYCKKCGHRTLDDTKLACEKCGVDFTSENSIRVNDSVENVDSLIVKNKNHKLRKIIGGLFVIGIIGWNLYTSLDNNAVDQNNSALEIYESGDNAKAIEQFKQAVENAVTTQTKIDTMKNLAYVYSDSMQIDEATTIFKQALALTTEGSFDNHLIKGEIAMLEKKSDAALSEYNKAYALEPMDFQINNALTLFYLDIESTHPELIDYSKALIHAKQAYDVNKVPLTTKNLAITNFFTENYEETIRLYSLIDISKEPINQYFLGLAYAKVGDVANAKKNLKSAVAGGIEVPQEVNDYINSN